MIPPRIGMRDALIRKTYVGRRSKSAQVLCLACTWHDADEPKGGRVNETSAVGAWEP